MLGHVGSVYFWWFSKWGLLVVCEISAPYFIDLIQESDMLPQIGPN